MKRNIVFYYNNICYSFEFLNNCDSCRILLEDLFIIDLFKVHNHSYCFKAFFYTTKVIYSLSYYSTKSGLYDAVQNLLKKELSDVKQFLPLF